MGSALFVTYLNTRIQTFNALFTIIVLKLVINACVLFLHCSQLFALYDTLPEPSVKKMEGVVNTGINIVALVYFLVGY